MKSTILMTTAIFLMSAPSPDSKTISEMSAGFLSISSETALLAAEVAPKAQIDSNTAKRLLVQSENEEIKHLN
jgi:hypothetical protein